MSLKPARFSSGEMTHRVTLYAPEGAFDVASAGDIATGIPAKIIAVPLEFQRREHIGAGGLQSTTAYTVMVRYREDIRTDHILIEECHTERRFHIVSIVPNERGDGLELTCIVGDR